MEAEMSKKEKMAVRANNANPTPFVRALTLNADTKGGVCTVASIMLLHLNLRWQMPLCNPGRISIGQTQASVPEFVLDFFISCTTKPLMLTEVATLFPGD